MKAANKISFKIDEKGNGYGHLFAHFGEDGNMICKELGMVSLCGDENLVATIVAILNQYKPTAVKDEQTELVLAESKMREAESRFKQLQKKQACIESEEPNANIGD